MSSGELIPNDDQPAPASNEIQFALVIARMIDTLKNDPEHMRHAVYELARYKLQEQFTNLDAKDVRRTRQEFETAIRGVEEFSLQQFSIPVQRFHHWATTSAGRTSKASLLRKPARWRGLGALNSVQIRLAF